jgi:mannose-1-phosphate guanylyltransferase
MKFIITAGGQGKKLWPYSRISSPKQFQKLIGDKSPFQINVEALLKGYFATDIFVSTKKQYLKIASSQAPQVSKKNFIIEPDIQKNRGPAEGLAFLKLSMLHPKEPFMIVQSDDLRVPNSAFLKMIGTMEKLVKRDRKYITGGIKALCPVMGNDYLEIGDCIETKSNIEIYKVKKFLGRSTDYGKTEKIIEDFHAVIHSNHGCWYPELMLEAYKKYRPDWYEGLMKIKQVIGTKNEESEITKIYSGMEKGPTEEVTKHIMPEGYIALLPFKWTDIGTWGSYYDFFAKDGEVCGGGNVVSLNSRKSLVKIKDPKKLVVLYNIDNLIVIDSGDVLLILPREDEGKVNTIVDELEKRGLKDLV